MRLGLQPAGLPASLTRPNDPGPQTGGRVHLRLAEGPIVMKDVLDSFERLEQKLDLFHKPKGPGGGQFTSAPGGDAPTPRLSAERTSRVAATIRSGSSGPGYGKVQEGAAARGDTDAEEMKPRAGTDYGPGDPRNDPEYEKYVNKIDAIIDAALGRGESTHQRFGIDTGEVNKKGEPIYEYTAARQKEHDKIIDKIMADNAHVPNDHQALMLGGLPGAGKSTFLKKHGEGLGEFLHVLPKDTKDAKGRDISGQPTNAIIINPDDMKSLLLNSKDSNGNPLVPRTPGLTDGEHASIVHEESSHLAAMLAARAMAEGKNVIFDITLGDGSKGTKKYLTNKLGTGAKDLGYKVHAAFIDGKMSTSLHRAGLRHKNIDKSTGQRTYSGRYVKYSHILGERNKEGTLASDGSVAKSQNRVEYDKLVKDKMFDSAVRHDNTTGKTVTDIPPVTTHTALGDVPDKLDTLELAQMAEIARNMAKKK